MHVRPRNEIVKKVLVVIALLSTISLPVWAIIQSSNVPASNQYCMATALIGSLFTGLLIVNILYIILITCIVKKRKPNAKTCAPYKAVRIVKDMQAVNEVKSMFTLADVNPSMLDASMFSNKSEISMQNALLKIHVPKLVEVKERRGTQQTEEDQEGVENIQIAD